MFDFRTRVLVVDDMLTMRKIVEKSVKELGFKDVLSASDGQKAWEQLVGAEPPVGLIISDWNMPNCSGLDFLKRIKADGRFKSVPFVLLTAESEAKQVMEAMKAGVDNYIVKPFTPDILLKKLEDTYKKVSSK